MADSLPVGVRALASEGRRSMPGRGKVGTKRDLLERWEETVLLSDFAQGQPGSDFSF